LTLTVALKTDQHYHAACDNHGNNGDGESFIAVLLLGSLLAVRYCTD